MMNKPKEVSAEKQTPPTAEEMESGLRQEEKKKKKKGCLMGMSNFKNRYCSNKGYC